MEVCPSISWAGTFLLSERILLSERTVIEAVAPVGGLRLALAVKFGNDKVLIYRTSTHFTQVILVFDVFSPDVCQNLGGI